MRKWTENEEIKRKWREYEEIERKWRETDNLGLFQTNLGPEDAIFSDQ